MVGVSSRRYEAILEKPSDRRNFAALLAQGVFRNVGMELGSEKLVLPFLYATLGGAVFYAGLLIPAAIIARLGAQLLGARLIAITPVSKWYLAMGTVVAAIPLAIVSLVAGDIGQGWLPLVFLATAMVVGFSPNFTLILSKRLLLHEDFFVHWLQSVHWL
jgi:hypothetical protein